MDYLPYLRKDKLPHIWCEGCGNGIVLKSLLRAIHSIGWDKDKIAGRAIAFATGLKLARPDLNVIVITGDGDATAIGGNHFIHAARRNIDLTVLVYNNYIYGMTGGQVSPTTPYGKYTTTSPYGNPEHPFDISGLAVAAGASFVARATTYHFAKLDKYIKLALQKKGFSVVEVLTPCPTSYGRKNKEGRGVDMLFLQKEIAIPLEKAEKLGARELEGKIVIGIFQDIEKEEYTQMYNRLREKIKSNH